MDLKEIKQLIKMVETADITEFEIEEKGNKIKISKTFSSNSHSEMHVMPAMMPQMQQQVASAAPSPAVDSAPESKKMKDNVVEIRSPMVGTFYSSPSPDSDPYTDVGKTIKSGDTLCIVEAMKLMNEIEAEVAGKVVEILVENGQPVEYNQVLFLVEKS